MRKAMVVLLPLVLAGCASGSQVANIEQYQENQWRATTHEFDKIRSYYRSLDQRLQRLESSVNRIDDKLSELGVQEGSGGRYIGPSTQTMEPIK